MICVQPTLAVCGLNWAAKGSIGMEGLGIGFMVVCNGLLCGLD